MIILRKITTRPVYNKYIIPFNIAVELISQKPFHISSDFHSGKDEDEWDEDFFYKNFKKKITHLVRSALLGETVWPEVLYLCPSSVAFLDDPGSLELQYSAERNKPKSLYKPKAEPNTSSAFRSCQLLQNIFPSANATLLVAKPCHQVFFGFFRACVSDILNDHGALLSQPVLCCIFNSNSYVHFIILWLG